MCTRSSNTCTEIVMGIGAFVILHVIMWPQALDTNMYPTTHCKSFKLLMQ